MSTIRLYTTVPFTRDSKPGAFLLNPGFGFGKPQNPGFGSGSGLVRVWENGDCIQVKP